MSSEETFVENFLKSKDLIAKRFTVKEQKQSKTPDFRVFKDGNLAFFCEVKTVSKDDWLDQQLASVPAGTIAGGSRKDPIPNRLSNRIHEAVKQFDAVNPDLKYPNVLVFVNHDDMCGFLNLIAVTTGNFIADNGNKYPIYCQFSEGRIKEEKFKIHLYIWLNLINRKQREQYHFNQSTSKEMTLLCNYFNQDHAAIKNFS